MKKLIVCVLMVCCFSCGDEKDNKHQDSLHLNGTWRSVDNLCAREVIFFDENNFNETAYCVDQTKSNRSVGTWSYRGNDIVMFEYLYSTNENLKGKKYRSFYNRAENKLVVNGNEIYTLSKVSVPEPTTTVKID